MNYCLWHLHGPRDAEGNRPTCVSPATASYARVSYCEPHAKEAAALDIDPIADECDNDPKKAGPLDVDRISARRRQKKGLHE